MSNSTFSDRSSRFVSILGGVCVIHCLATPFLVVLLPSFSHFFTDTAEMILVLSVVPIGVAGFYPTWIKHKNTKVHFAFLMGMIALLISQFMLHIDHEMIGSEWNSANFLEGGSKILLSVFGALFMAWSMYKNRKHTHSCSVPSHVH